MNAQGYKTSVALAPKTSTDQPGLLYEGMDYALLGANADNVFLMTYEWGYTYGPPMAVAPLNKVRQVVEYALTQIPKEKILMGIPNYAYDWALPYERGITKARLIGNVEAVHIAAENGVSIQYDDLAQSPHFNYTRNGIAHEVWFEDVRSIEAKLNLAREYELLGVGSVSYTHLDVYKRQTVSRYSACWTGRRFWKTILLAMLTTVLNICAAAAIKVYFGQAPISAPT